MSNYLNSYYRGNRACFSILILLLLGGVSGCKEEIAKVGAEAPPVAAFDVRHQEIKLETYRGKPLVLEFWSESCGVCLLMMKDWQNLVQARPDDLTVIGVNIDDKNVDFNAVADELGITFLLGKDQLGITQERYLVSVTPTTFFIDKHGVIDKMHVGYSTGMDLNNYINQLKNQK
ncbi:TlpA family protein disulfide reductase [Vibrio sp. HA2012]|uniref:TlpA family protein disulfide reductase n=1 Tax=Vibrio sp. HA2012 TaxID=1971595 RepID=UPI0012FD0A01|nr:TlpA disulfide reductase family protein [Vibrio sp. HA2012]